MKKTVQLLTVQEKNDLIYKMFFIKTHLSKINLYNKIKYILQKKYYILFKDIYTCDKCIGYKLIYGNTINTIFDISIIFSKDNYQLSQLSNQILIIYYTDRCINKLINTLVKLKTDKTDHVIRKTLYVILHSLKKENNKDV